MKLTQLLKEITRIPTKEEIWKWFDSNDYLSDPYGIFSYTIEAINNGTDVMDYLEEGGWDTEDLPEETKKYIDFTIHAFKKDDILVNPTDTPVGYKYYKVTVDSIDKYSNDYEILFHNLNLK